MDAKITKSRLGHYLSYEWIKIVAIIVGVIIVWSLAFTTFRTPLTVSQAYNVYNYIGTSVGVKFNDCESLVSKKTFSYEVYQCASSDLSTNEQYIDSILQTRLSVREMDCIFTANAPSDRADWTFKDLDGNQKQATWLEGFLYAYKDAVMPFDGENGLLSSVENYVDPYFTNGYEDLASLDESAVETDFRARIAKTKDKRFKNETQIQNGVEDEIKRIRLYAQALKDFYGYLNEGVVALQPTTLYIVSDDGTTVTGSITKQYSLNLCPDENTMNVKDYAYHYVDDGQGNLKKSGKDVQLVLFNTKADFNIFNGEHLLFINDLIEKCKLV